MSRDTEQFDEMVAECYQIMAGSKRAIEIAKQAFEYAGVKLGPNKIFYEIKTTKETRNKLVIVTDKELKIEILQHLHII